MGWLPCLLSLQGKSDFNKSSLYTRYWKHTTHWGKYYVLPFNSLFGFPLMSSQELCWRFPCNGQQTRSKFLDASLLWLQLLTRKLISSLIFYLTSGVRFFFSSLCLCYAENNLRAFLIVFLIYLNVEDSSWFPIFINQKNSKQLSFTVSRNLWLLFVIFVPVHRIYGSNHCPWFPVTIKTFYLFGAIFLTVFFKWPE